MNKETDELNRLENNTEVFAPVDSFETAPQTIQKGPFYAAAEEVMPELEATEPSVAGIKEDSKNKAFPVDRRDFMKLFSMSTVAGAAACVRRPAETAVPYVNQPVDQVPGVPTHYATTCGSCSCACGVVVKTKEGRPVKLEGHREHPISQGALCSMGQADIQGLYHPERLKSPMMRRGFNHQDIAWEDVYKLIGERVKDTPKVGILTGGSTGTSDSFYADVLRKLGSSEKNLFTWEPNSLFHSVAKAHQICFGDYSIPRAELHEAKVIVGIGSDFLDAGLSNVFHTKGFTQSQAFAKGEKGEFIQFESSLTLTGGKADKRFVIPAGNEWLVSLVLMKALFEHKKSKGSQNDRRRIEDILRRYDSIISTSYQKLSLTRDDLAGIAEKMLNQNSVVMAGGAGNFDENSTLLQVSAVCLNILVGAYGQVLQFDKGWMRPPVGDGDMQRFVKMAAKLDVLFVIDSNPVFTAPPSWGIASILEKIPTVISIQSFPNEVDEKSEFVLPNHHYLEAWGDEQPVAGFWSLRQPTVRATTNSRQAEDSLLWILAHAGKSLPYQDYKTYLESKWKSVYSYIGANVSFKTFFQAVLRRGFIGKLSTRATGGLKDIRKVFETPPTSKEGVMLVAPFDHRLLDGRGAHLPVLQEIGDSLTTITWDSWIALNPNTMAKLGIKRNQVVRIEGEGGWYETSVYPMPGVHEDAVVTHRGNGHRDKRSTISNEVGINPLVVVSRGEDPWTGMPSTSNQKVKIIPTDRWYRLATMQKHNDIADRTDIVKKVDYETARTNKKHKDLDNVPDLFPKLEVAEHKWGMSIDLDRCSGCGACMVACAIENNVPQVGRDQVLMGREMHWIRLDRYFYGDMDNPTVTFQPMMCQHCNHAPCEAVCPVFATTHDAEGMNAMTYNRCVGTRYCANACPYKVRRFNWWTHKWGEFGKEERNRNPRAMNPDVTVRTRGVMEKCSFCVGRLRDAKHLASEQNRKLVDGEALTACQQTCAADAITFGNLNDPTSKITGARKDPRAYLVLGADPDHAHYGLKTLPSVSYLAEVVNELPKNENDHH